MIETIEHRVVRLEVKVDDHDEELNELRATSKALSSALHGIEKTLLHIKWLAMGGVVVMFGKELGVEKVLTIILGVL
jgi:hypothetical protein